MALERMGRRGVRRGELTDAEINEAAAEAQAGGFSRRMTGPGAGRVARDVFSTGFAPDQGRGAQVPIDPSASTSSQLKQYIQNKAPTWAVRSVDWLLGGWVEDDGKVNLDTSVATPRTTGGLSAAVHMGTYGDQDSIGNLGKAGQGDYGTGYLGDIKMPAHLSRSQFYKSRGMDAPLRETIEPVVSTRLVEGVNEATGQPQIRERRVIEPSRLEQVQVEAQLMAEKMNLKDDLAPKGYKLA